MGSKANSRTITPAFAIAAVSAIVLGSLILLAAWWAIAALWEYPRLLSALTVIVIIVCLFLVGRYSLGVLRTDNTSVDHGGVKENAGSEAQDKTGDEGEVRFQNTKFTEVDIGNNEDAVTNKARFGLQKHLQITNLENGHKNLEKQGV